MMIVKVFGGLGNQMFQYVFSRYIGINGGMVKYDISQFNNYFIRDFELDKIFNLKLQDKLASECEINESSDNGAFLNGRIKIGKYILRNPNVLIRKTHFIQSNFSYFYTFSLLNNYKYLEGYWQNLNYISLLENEIRKSFVFPEPSGKNLEVISRMLDENSVGIHIRKLDKPHTIKDLIYYLKLKLIWRVCSIDYYKKCMSFINNNVNNPKFYLFTDDVDWVKNKFPINENLCIVDWNRGSDSFWDMFLLTKCKHKIISMSSFSWWGAWLGKNNDGYVLAPKKWSLRFTRVYDLIPNSWIRI